jgi:hypothetical protein
MIFSSTSLSDHPSGKTGHGWLTSAACWFGGRPILGWPKRHKDGSPCRGLSIWRLHFWGFQQAPIVDTQDTSTPLEQRSMATGTATTRPEFVALLASNHISGASFSVWRASAGFGTPRWEKDFFLFKCQIQSSGWFNPLMFCRWIHSISNLLTLVNPNILFSGETPFSLPLSFFTIF